MQNAPMALLRAIFFTYDKEMFHVKRKYLCPRLVKKRF